MVERNPPSEQISGWYTHISVGDLLVTTSTPFNAEPTVRAQVRDMRSSSALDLGMLSTIPLVQAMINDGWLYSPAGWLDPWYYLGYGLNYTDPSFLNDYYKISRLPWILMEFAARNLFSPVIASWILQLGTLALGICCLYLLFSRTLGRPAAFVGAAVFAAFPFAHASGGADYHNAFAGPLYALTWWLAIRCADLGGSRTRLFWVGVAGALSLHSCIVFASLMPIMAMHYVWAHRDKHGSWPPVLETIIAVAAGGIAITLVLGVVNASIGRDFFFFMRQFNLATSFVVDSSLSKTWWHSWSSGWFWAAQYLGPFAAALLIAPVMLIAAWVHRPKFNQVMMYSAGYGLTGLLWIFWQTQGQVALDWFYFTYPLVFPLAGAIAAQFAFWIPMDKPLSVVPKLVICVILVGSLAYFNNVIDRVQFLPSSPFVEATIIGLLYGAIVFLAIPRGLRLWGGVVGLSGCFAFSMIVPSQYSPAKCSLSRDVENAMDAAHRFVREEQRSQGLTFSQTFLWADKQEIVAIPQCEGGMIDLGDFEPSLTSTGFRYLEPPWGVPRMEAISSQRLAEVAVDRALVVYVTNHTDRVDQLMERFAAVGAVASAREFHMVDMGSLHIPIYLFLVSKKKKL